MVNLWQSAVVVVPESHNDGEAGVFPHEMTVWDELRNSMTGRASEVTRKRVADALENPNSLESQFSTGMTSRMLEVSTELFGSKVVGEWSGGVRQ